MMVGCEYKTDVEIEEEKRLNGFNIIIVDSCEYLKDKEGSGYLGYGFLAHKGNCRFCKERRQKEMEELEEKATQLSQKYFPDEENIWARSNIEAHKCKSACIEMVEWLKAQKGE